MKPFNLIIGLTSLFASAYCIFYPDLEYVLPFLISFIIFLWSICSLFVIIKENKKFPKNKIGIITSIVYLLVGLSSFAINIRFITYDKINSGLCIELLCVITIVLFLDIISNIYGFFKLNKYNLHKKSKITYLLLSFLNLTAIIIVLVLFKYNIITINILIGIGLITISIKLIASLFIFDYSKIAI